MVNQIDGYTIAEAAEALGISARSVRRHVKTGLLEADLVSGKHGATYMIKSLDMPGDRAVGRRTLDSPTLAFVQGMQRENKELRGEVVSLAHQLGVSEERVRSLEGRVLLLTEGRAPWWRRLIGRGHAR